MQEVAACGIFAAVTTSPLLAGSVPAFFPEAVGLLIATAAIAYVGYRARILPIIAFLVTGALVGPHALGLVRNEALIDAAAELGVILLLFTIGIEFSLERLARIQRLIFVGGGLQVALVIGLVTAVLTAAGVGWRAAVFTGCLVALSSTAIVMKILAHRRETRGASGDAALGILIFQDLAVVAMVLLVPMLAGRGGSAGDVALALAKAAAIVALVLLVARRVMPHVLEAVARTCSQEIFLLTVVAICFGTAYLTSLAGVSLSLGAFLAGLVVSESGYSQMAVGEILPLQILFSAAFFVSVGLLLDPAFLWAHPLLVLGAIGGSLLVKILAGWVSLRALGVATGTAACTSVLLAQVGEFSFVLERAGRALGLHPAGLAEAGPQTFVAATVIMMIATAPVTRLSDWLVARWRRETPRAPATDASAAAPDPGLRDHVVIAGYGEIAHALATALAAQRVPSVILTLSPEGARAAERAGLRVLRGNYARRHELSVAGAREARALVIADDDPTTTRQVVAAAREIRRDLPVVARVRDVSDAPGVRAAGATQVVVDRDEAIARVMGTVLGAAGVDAETVARHQEAARGAATTAAPTIRLRHRQRHSRHCSHAAGTRDVVPSSTDCGACRERGDSWVHLRICMTCGLVACCDASPNTHASRHAQATGHPVVRSFEPGEDWAWCYVDETYL